MLDTAAPHLPPPPQLHKQAELTAAANAAWQEREARRYDKHAAIDMEREAQRAAAEERQMQVGFRVEREESVYGYRGTWQRWCLRGKRSWVDEQKHKAQIPVLTRNPSEAAVGVLRHVIDGPAGVVDEGPCVRLTYGIWALLRHYQHDSTFSRACGPCRPPSTVLPVLGLLYGTWLDTTTLPLTFVACYKHTCAPVCALP